MPDLTVERGDGGRGDDDAPFAVNDVLLGDARGAHSGHVVRADEVDRDDIAAACGFLCSDAASYITGQVIAVNGGGFV